MCIILYYKNILMIFFIRLLGEIYKVNIGKLTVITRFIAKEIWRIYPKTFLYYFKICIYR